MPTAGRRAAANLCIYPHKGRITVNEGKLRGVKKRAVAAPALKEAELP